MSVVEILLLIAAGSVLLPALWDRKHRARLAEMIPTALRSWRPQSQTLPANASDEERWRQNQADHERAFTEISKLHKQVSDVDKHISASTKRLYDKIDEQNRLLSDLRERVARLEGDNR